MLLLSGADPESSVVGRLRGSNIRFCKIFRKTAWNCEHFGLWRKSVLAAHLDSSMVVTNVLVLVASSWVDKSTWPKRNVLIDNPCGNFLLGMQETLHYSSQIKNEHNNAQWTETQDLWIEAFRWKSLFIEGRISLEKSIPSTLFSSWIKLWFISEHIYTCLGYDKRCYSTFWKEMKFYFFYPRIQ